MNSSSMPFSRLHFAAFVAIACVAAQGCKSHGNSELLERELRCQEDRIYQLEDELDEMCNALESSRRENQALKKEVSGGDKGPGQSAPSVSVPGAPSVDGVPSLDAPAVESPSIEAPKYEFVPRHRSNRTLEEAPQFEEVPHSDSPEPQMIDPSDEAPPFKRASHERPVLSGDSRTITRLAVNRQLTGGWNSDQKHGDEGIFVAFEPRDSQSKLVEAAGDVSIVVLDPGKSGAEARVARWDFTTDEAEQHFRKGAIGRGLQFELPWPSNPPTSRDLRLFVRLTTMDGRKVETSSKIRVTLCDGWSAKNDEEAPAVAEKPEVPDILPADHSTASRNLRVPRAWSPDR